MLAKVLFAGTYSTQQYTTDASHRAGLVLNTEHSFKETEITISDIPSVP